MKAQTNRKLTANEQKALNKEIDRQLQIQAEKHGCNMDATVLLTLYLHFGFGKEKLREFWEKYSETEKTLFDYYYNTPLTAEGVREREFLATYELKGIGVDVEYWRKVKKEWKPEEDKVWMKTQNTETNTIQD